VSSRRDLVRTAADPEQVTRATRKTNQRERDRQAFDREQLDSVNGRRWVWALIEECEVFADVIGPIEVLARHMGLRSAGVALMKRCQEHPRLYMLMVQEALARRQSEQVENVAAHTASATTEEGMP
jgi:hypothetical protein